VNFLLRTRQQNFFSSGFGAIHPEVRIERRLRTFLRLFRVACCVKSVLLLQQFPAYKVVRHRFEKIIAGRSVVIEVTWVADKRWRAHIVRIPGVPTAMMPFYGETPDEAATHLSKWLDRAHQHQANTV
jgi:predicted RNase H-like HicB family nuclease